MQWRSLRKDGQMTGALIFKQNNSRMVEDFDIHAYSKLHDYLFTSVLNNS
jgi:hypothetical protein